MIRRIAFGWVFCAIVAVLALSVGADGTHAQGVQSVNARKMKAGGRLVITWQRPVKFSAVASGNRVLVLFDRPLTASLSSVPALLPHLVKSAVKSPDGHAMTLVLSKPHSLRSWRRGKQVVLELTDKAAAAAEKTPEQPKTVVGASPQPPKQAFVGQSKPKQPVTGKAPPKQSASSPKAAAKPPIDGQKRAPEKKPTSPSPKQSAQPATPTKLTKPMAEASKPETSVAKPAPAKADAKAGAKPDATAPPSSSGAKGVTTEGGTTVGAGTKEKGYAPAAADDKAPHVRVVASDGRPALRFQWATEVALAAFRRGRNIWLVFDKQAPFDVDGLRSQLGDSVAAIDLVAHPKATVVRIAIDAKYGMKLTRDGKAWQVAFVEGFSGPRTNIGIDPQPSAASGGRIFLVTNAAAQPIALPDPDAGDTLIVVPVTRLGLGVAIARRYTKFALMRTVQGVAVEVFADGTRIRTEKAGIGITNQRGLHLSRRAARSLIVPGEAERQKRLFRFVKWLGGPAESFPNAFFSTRQKLQQAITAAKTEPERNARRLALARFYFAHGQASDVLGVLSAIERSDPALARTADVVALRGGSRLLLRQVKTAGRDLFDLRLDASPEVGLWRGAAAAMGSQWRNADAQFRRADRLLADYPPRIRTQFMLLAAEAAIETGDIDRARALLEALSKTNLDAKGRSLVAFLNGRILAKTGQRKKALELWDDLARKTDGEARVRATLAAAASRMAHGELESKKAIDTFERLRFAWRGGPLEFEINDMLGRIYRKAEQYERSLKAFDRARRYDPDLAKTRKVGARMRRVMADLYVHGKADSLTPLRALSLFHEYADLIPAGPSGDVMIAKLADRLVAVDLLGRAADLLTQQIEKRLKGAEKARVGARLALVRLLDRKPKDALTALDKTTVADMPADLAAQRRRLRARALGTVGRTADALGILAADQSREADLLRADLNWKAQNWGKAAEVYARLAQKIPANATSLDEKQSRIVLAWASALALAGDQGGLKALRARFDKPMLGGPYKDAYRIVASELSGGALNYKAIVAKVAEVDKYQSFMTSYRERIAKSGLGAIN